VVCNDERRHTEIPPIVFTEVVVAVSPFPEGAHIAAESRPIDPPPFVVIKMAHGALVGVLAIACTASPIWAMSFVERFGPALRPLGAALADSIGQSLPIASASPGVVYQFDWSRSAFVREISIFGPLYLERAGTLGANNANLSVNYQTVKVGTLNGADVSHLSDTGPPIAVPGNGGVDTLRIPKFAMDLFVHQLIFSGTYGVTDRLDLNLTVPLLYSEFGLDAVFSGAPPFHARASSFGAGDLLLRAKYLVRHSSPELAMGLALRLPTGNEDDFQGTGNSEITPLLAASTPSRHVAPRVDLRGHANVSVNVNTDDVGESQGRYGIGLDCAIAGRLTIAPAFLARHAFAPIAPAGFDVPRCHVGGTSPCRNQFPLPLFGIQNKRPDFYDFSIGGRINLWHEAVIGFANAIFPLNRDGFRADVIPLVGVEAIF
jgi:hypothetical protein